MSIETFELRLGTNQYPKLVQRAHKWVDFPGGESHIDFKPTASQQVALLRGADGNDLIKLAMWADACHRTLTVKDTTLLLPYLPGARADRGTPLGAKVYAQFINSLNIDHVVCVDPHSDVAPALYDRLITMRAVDVIPPLIGYSGIIAPDAGAIKRAQEVATLFALPLYQASKHRDFATGKLSQFKIDSIDGGQKKRFLVVDDICDAGGTFVGLAEAFEANNDYGRLDLWVTHGIFSHNAITKLKQSYGHVYTTDSHPGYVNATDQVVSLLLPMLKKSGKMF